MINGRQERLEKILRVRYRNLKLHKGRRAVYITFAFFYFLFDLIVLLIGSLPPSVMNMGVLGFVFAACQAIFLGIIAVSMSAQLFASDRTNNQIGIELRSGYDQRDIFLSRFIEIVVAFAIIWVVTALVNGLVGGVQWQGTPIKIAGNTDKSPYKSIGGLVDPRLSLCRAWSVITIWYSLIAFILTAGITIGFSYCVNMSGSIALGVIFGIGLTIVIILASVGTFSPQGFGTEVPGYGHIDLNGFMFGGNTLLHPSKGGGKDTNNMVQAVVMLLTK